MNNLLKIEIKKMLKRKDFLIFSTMLFIPILYSVGVAFNSSVITYEANTKTYALDFCNSMFIFVYMVFIYFIFLSLTSIKSLRGEIENKSIRLYTQRINDRKKIYFYKNISCVVLLTIVCILFIIISLVLYYLFVTKRTDIATFEFIKINELGYIIMSFLSIYFFFIISIFYSLMLSMYVKSNLANVIYILTFIACMYIKEFPYIQYLVPSYYIQSLTSILKYSSNSINTFYILCGITFIYCIICYLLGRNKFEKSDI